MWFARVFGSSRRRERRKHASRPRPRRLGLEPLEQRRLLTITISGNIDVSGLACANGGLVPVADAKVVASYTVGGQTTTSNPVWTDTNGYYKAVINSAASPSTPVTITVTAKSEEQAVSGDPMYRFTDDSETNTLSDTFTVTIAQTLPSPGNYSGSHKDDPNLDCGVDAEKVKAVSFAAFSMLHADYEAALNGLNANLTDALAVIPLPDKGSGDSSYTSNTHTIRIGLDAVAAHPDIVSHEFGHYVADEGGFYAKDEVGEKHRFWQDIRTNGQPFDSPSSVLTTPAMISGFEEGWADYFAVVMPSLTPASWLHIPELNDHSYTTEDGTEYKAAKTEGWGEDNEASVMRILYQLTDKNNPQCLETPAQLYSFLSTNNTKTLSAFWKAIPPTNPTTLSQIQTTANIAGVFVANGVGPAIAAPTINTQGATPTISVNFSVPNLPTNNLPTYANVPTFTAADIFIYNAAPNAPQLQVYDSGQGTLAMANSGGPLTEVTTAGNSASQYRFRLPAATTASLLASPPAQYLVLVKTYCTIAGGGLSGPYWSELAQLTVPLQVTGFKGDKTRNLLDLSYQIVPPATGWPGNNVPVTIPPFNIDLYAVRKGSLSDARAPANLVGCYAVTNPAVLKGTAASNQFVVTLDPGVMNSTLLQTLYSNGSHYLVAELDFTGGASIVVRFQGGNFQTGDGKVYSLGGASLAFDSPDTSNYSDSATIASAAGTVTASGTITDVGGDVILQYNQTFTGTTGAVYACTYDNTSAINGSGLDASTSLIVWGGNGDNSFIGGAGNDSLTVGNGTNTLTDLDGDDTLAAGDGNNTLTAGNGNDTLTVGDGNNTLTAGNGNDTLTLGEGNNTVTLGNGNDDLFAENGDNVVTAGNGNDSLDVGNGNNNLTVGNGVDYLQGGNGDNTFVAGNGNDGVMLGSGNNLITVGNDDQDGIIAGGGDNCIDYGTGATIHLGNGDNTIRQDGPDSQFDDYESMRVGDGNNVFFLDARSANSSEIIAGSGVDQLIFTHVTPENEPTITSQGPPFATFVSFPCGAQIYVGTTGVPVEYTLVEDGVQNSLTLDNGGTVHGLDGIPAGTNVTLDNGTSLDLCQSASLGTLTVVNGMISNSSTNGTITASSYLVENGTIAANLGGTASLTLSGNGVVYLTGNNTYTGGTTIGTTTEDTGTLAVGPDGLGSGPVTFVGPGTLQALGDLSLNQAIVTPGAGLAATIDTNACNVAASGGVSGDGDLLKIGDGTLDLSGVNNSGLLGNLIVEGGFVAASAENDLGSVSNSALIFDGGGLQWTSQFNIPAGKEIDVRAGGAAFDANGFDVTIAAAIGTVVGSDTSGAAGGITVMDSSSGGGVLCLSGDNIFQGNVEIASGMADFEMAVSLPSSATILIDSDGALEVDPAGPYATATAWLESTVIETTSSGVLALAGNSSEDIDMSGFPSLNLGAAADVNYSGTLSPCDDTYLLGGGPGTLTVASALTGDGVVINGNVALGRANDSMSDLTVNGTFDLKGYSVVAAALVGSGTIQSSSAPATLTVGGDAGTSTFNGTLRDSSNGQLAVEITGGATLVLAGSDTFTGSTTIDSESVLDAGSSTALSPNSVLVVNGMLDLCGFSNTAGPLTGSGAVQSSPGPATLTVAGADTAFYGTLADGVGPLSLLVTGPGTAVLGGDNTSMGGVGIDDGTTVELASATALGTGDLTVNGKLDLEGYSVAVSGLWGSGTMQTSGASATLSVGGNGEWSSFTGILQDRASGQLALLVTGGNTLALAAGNTNSGGTAVQNATLQIPDPTALGAGGLTLDGGTLQAMGVLVLTGPITLGPGGGVIDSDNNFVSVQGTVQGVGDLNVVDSSGTGNGVLAIDANNTSSGRTSVSGGLFVVMSSSALPYGTALTVGADGTVIFDDSGTPTLTDPGQGMNSPVNGLGGTNPPTNAAPVVTSIQCVGQSLVDADTVQFTVDFSASVTGVSASSFAVDGNGTTGAVTSVVESSYSQYTVTVSGITGSGNIGLSVLDGGTILDWFGTPLATTATIPVDQQYTIDRQLYWDASGGYGPAGGSGTWGTGYTWRVGSLSGPLQAWVDGSDAVFAGAPGTVSIANPVVVSSITVLSDGYLIDGNTITLGCPQTTIDIAVGSITINSNLLGNALVKNGDGTLVLDGVDSYSCSTTVYAGTLWLQNGSALPAQTALTVNGGLVDLGGATAGMTTVTLAGGSIVDGTLDTDTALNLYSGVVLAELTGSATLDKLGPGTVVLAGDNTYQGGTNALDGTLVAAYQDSLPSTAIGPGTIIVRPTLYWSGSGDWTTGTWELANGTPTPWIDGSSVVLTAGSEITISGLVNVTAISITGDATIAGGTLSLSSGSITVLSGTVAIDSQFSGSGGLVKTGTGTLVVNGTLTYSGMTEVATGTLDLQSPLTTASVIAGGRAIGPGALFGSGGQSLYNLDPAMFNLVQSLFVDQAVDRADMIQILESAIDNGGVTSSALDALEILTTPQNESRLNMPDYVAVLANDVVWGNPANASYQGQPLGNLANQGSDQLLATALNDLVDKWFFGTDQPAIDASAVAAGATYSVVAGSLFGDNPNQALDVPSSADMYQGALGDCYLIAALGALADSSPTAIENMIIPNGVESGIAGYTVRFYYQSGGAYVPDYVTVSGLLPGYSNGALVYARAGADGSWWMPLIEKAYAEWNQTGREGRDSQNAYASLYSGCMQAVDAQVLGSTATTYCPAGDPTAKQAVIAALNNGEAVTAGIFVNGDATRFNQLGLVSGHAYVVMGYDSDPTSPTFDTFRLENPWGCYEPTASLTWGDLTAYCGGLAVADTASTVPLASANSQATELSGSEIRATALKTGSDRQHTLDAAWVAYLASNGDSEATDTTQDTRIRALDIVLAEYGRC